MEWRKPGLKTGLFCKMNEKSLRNWRRLWHPGIRALKSKR
jgi:hypothetical protein